MNYNRLFKFIFIFFVAAFFVILTYRICQPYGNEVEYSCVQAITLSFFSAFCGILPILLLKRTDCGSFFVATVHGSIIRSAVTFVGIMGISLFFEYDRNWFLSIALIYYFSFLSIETLCVVKLLRRRFTLDFIKEIAS
jgi:hypothetical protein